MAEASIESNGITGNGTMRTYRFVSGTHRRLSFKFWFGLHLSALILLLHPATVHAQTQRKSVTNLSATELMSLRRGVAHMMARNSAPRGSANSSMPTGARWTAA